MSTDEPPTPTLVPVQVGKWMQYVKNFISGKDTVKYTIGEGTSDSRSGDGACKIIRTSETTSSFQLNQGNEYLKNKSSVRPKMNMNNSTDHSNHYNWKGDIIEGNSGMIGPTKTEVANNISINETNQFIDKYNQNISDYASKHKFLMDKTNNYLTRSENKNPYINKNVKLSDGKLGYVTAKGVFKWYPSQSIYDQTAGKNGCPSEIINVNASSDNKLNSTIYADYPLRVGTEMKMGQSCGNEGTNVFVSQATEKNVSEKYAGCYRKPSTGLDFQSDMTYNVSIESCKTRAIDIGSSGFAVSSNGSSRKCYTVSDPSTVYSSGIATKTNTSYKLIESSSQGGTSTVGGILLDGTIGIGNNSNFNTDPASDNNAKSTEYVSKSLFTSNPLYAGCTNSGALINSADTIASYGSNCTNKIPPVIKPVVPNVPKPTTWQVIKNLSTPFNDQGGGNTVFLDRHDTDCGDGGIKGFHLVLKDGTYHYEYSCSAPFMDGNNVTANEVKGPTSKSTGLAASGGGNSIFLDRHQVDCGEDGAIAQFKLKNDGDNYQYNYKCINMGKPMTSRIVTTPANDSGGGNAIFLDRHDVTCAADEVMNDFTLIRPSDNQIAYKYRCSKFDPPSSSGKKVAAPSGPKPPPIPPTVADTDSNKLGVPNIRYVEYRRTGVSKIGPNLIISQIMVFDEKGNNISKEKKCTPKTGFSGNRWPCTIAVDGLQEDKDTSSTLRNWDEGMWTNYVSGDDHFIRVDLEGDYIISKIKIFNSSRANGTEDRDQGLIKLYTKADPDTPVKLNDGTTSLVVAGSRPTETFLLGKNAPPQPTPSDVQARCNEIHERTQVIPYKTWGSTTKDEQTFWDANGCNQKLCKYWANKYHIVPHNTWGSMPEQYRGSWDDGNMKCNDRV